MPHETCRPMRRAWQSVPRCGDTHCFGNSEPAKHIHAGQPHCSCSAVRHLRRFLPRGVGVVLCLQLSHCAVPPSRVAHALDGPRKPALEKDGHVFDQLAPLQQKPCRAKDRRQRSPVSSACEAASRSTIHFAVAAAQFLRKSSTGSDHPEMHGSGLFRALLSSINASAATRTSVQT